MWPFQIATGLQFVHLRRTVATDRAQLPPANAVSAIGGARRAEFLAFGATFGSAVALVLQVSALHASRATRSLSTQNCFE